MQGDPSRPATGYPVPNGFPPPQPGVAYPYQAPPPQSYPYYNPQPYPYPSSSSTSFARRFLTAMIVVFFLIGVSILILWLVLRPRLPAFQVDSLSVSNFSSGSNYSSSITGLWNVGFSVYNPNKKMSISYEEVQSLLFYKSELISQTRIPPFKQGKRNQTVIDASFSATATYVHRWVVNDISGDRAGGSVSFSVIVDARVQFRAGGWRARNRLLRVLCEGLSVGISSNSSGSGTLVGGAKDCRVGL
ncbi:hypothetical protein I3843_14G096000 [Carya illinoinensis]|uniref:Late embryogenesis abundant protein LEA-2 subgroup domain-containing protein n=1 Tax=Carya illinoinensis TaxID=32201 RepID=A0A8T1NLE8_CARIL|nr:uncharacterized protein At1g08160-like [Carya illinoinensis]KAG2670673.1 hypothetical protein I3760_14G097700 [Carya illinoinensis]KAG6629610.1 hypothetical protein CIPAW_14G096100 [Carya illinoinensis]KAG6678786.1 hypothetical protein I3842_14G098400 [Carya illinoinensis]KAG7947468.1 hypothetical protein I3843_14G096000 [Carya illinoinensis]